MSSSNTTPPTTIQIPSSSTITCLCGSISTPLSLAKHTSFPIPIELCHCNTCRHTSGAISGAFIELKSSPPDAILSKCTKYDSSTKVSRYFCPICGSHLFIDGWAPEQPSMWFAWAGVVDRAEDDGFDVDTGRVTVQAFVNDTIDGGIAGRMGVVAHQNPSGPTDALKIVYNDVFEGSTLSVQDLVSLYESSKSTTSSTSTGQPSEKIRVQCHCGNVTFRITRPSPSAYPSHIQYYIKSKNTKYLARFCACRSCRSATGNPLNAWTYIPPANIETVDGQTIDFDFHSDAMRNLLGVVVLVRGLVRRSFCGKCGASIFFEDRERDWVVDVSVGLLRSERGVLAEDWLEWNWDEVSYEEECRVKEMVECVRGAGKGIKSK